MSEVETTLTLTGFRNGLSSTLNTSVGTISGGTTLTGTTGFAISEETEKDLTFNVVSLTGNVEVDDPATVAVVALYTQDQQIAELDLDLRWADMPDGSELAISSSTGKLNVSRRNISGSDSFGVFDKKAPAGDTVFTIEIWIKNPDALTADSKVTMILSSIKGGGGGPVDKTTLEKLRFDLG